MKEAEILAQEIWGAYMEKGYFIATFLGMRLKGNRCYCCKISFEDPTFIMLTLLAVIIGHIYPVLFKGKGGKGISTFIGGLIAFDYLIALTLIGILLYFI